MVTYKPHYNYAAVFATRHVVTQEKEGELVSLRKMETIQLSLQQWCPQQYHLATLGEENLSVSSFTQLLE